VGCDKNSLTEQQKKKKTAIILIKPIYNMQISLPDAQLAPEQQMPLLQLAPT